MDFSRRSYKKELLDEPNVPADAIARNMEELEIINRKLGGHRVSLKGFEKLANGKNSITICEIGCGGGDNLKAIVERFSGKNLQIKVIGIDINPDCIAIAREKFSSPAARFIISDYQLVKFENPKPDIIFASLFCHHFTNQELHNLLLWMKENSGLGFFINDLHRSPFAYYSIRLLTSAFSRSYLVKNDAPLSVLRGFIKKDWQGLLDAADIGNYTIQWMWAFRWLIISKK
jgi:2-polyprenyl-3-methyl-5-hydroxy-6-metoxy-1,4-benzoquinol methylase